MLPRSSEMEAELGLFMHEMTEFFHGEGNGTYTCLSVSLCVVLCCVDCVLCIVYCVLCIVYCIVYCVLCIVYVCVCVSVYSHLRPAP